MQGSILSKDLLNSTAFKPTEFVFTKDTFGEKLVQLRFSRRHRSSCRVLSKISEKVCVVFCRVSTCSSVRRAGVGPGCGLCASRARFQPVQSHLDEAARIVEAQHSTQVRHGVAEHAPPPVHIRFG